MTNHQDVIAAFADGEAVQADSLKAALADAAGRDYLIDVLALRALVADPAIARPPAGVSRPAARPGGTRWWSAVAALVVAGATMGFFAGRNVSVPAEQAPVVETFIPAGITIPAPAPTQIIRLENGKDWNERGGGN